MKTDLKKQTKYFRRTYDKDKMKFILTEIPLNRDNWYYVQIDATIRTSFFKHQCPLPKYVIIEELSHYTTINIIRDTVKEKDILAWYDKSFFIKSELDIQAKCNSNEEEDTEDWIKYEFRII